MARRRSRSSRRARSLTPPQSIASSAAPPDFYTQRAMDRLAASIRDEEEPNLFNDEWLGRIREDPSIRYVDLSDVEDRRRYHPDNLRPPLTVRGLRTRIIVVPDRHPLARHGPTYGGKYTLDEVLRHERQKGKPRFRWTTRRWRYGNVKTYTRDLEVPRRLGFHMPWQVIICVRRRRRREVMHALRIAGKVLKGKGGGGSFRFKVRRNYYSEVRC